MWIWLASLGILVICFVFAWNVMANSYNIFSNDKTLFMFKSFTPSDMSYFQESLRAIKSKLKALEDQSAYYELQFTRIHEKLNQLEQSHPQASRDGGKVRAQDGEDWKELFYDENEKKETLENELDATQQELEAVKEELDLLKKGIGDNTSMKSDYDERLQEMQSLQNTILNLQKNLEGAAQRERELEIQLQQEIEARQELSKKESEYVALKSDFDTRLQDIQSLQNNIQVLQQDLEGAVQREKELGIQLHEETEARQAISKTEVDFNSLKSEYDTRNQEVQSLQNTIQELQNNLEGAAQHQKELESQFQQAAETGQALSNKESEYNSLKSEYDNRIQEVQSLQNTIQELQNNLEGAKQHQSELEVRLQHEVEARQEMANRESELISLRSENEGLKKQMTEMSMKQDEVEKKLLQFNEMESKLNIYEEEKSKMIANLETILKQTRPENQ